MRYHLIACYWGDVVRVDARNVFEAASLAKSMREIGYAVIAFRAVP